MANPIVKLARQQILRLLDGQRVQIPTSVGLLEIEAKADAKWVPLKKLAIPKGIFDLHVANNLKAPDELWSNDIYEVFVHYSEDEALGGRHLSIKRYDRAAVHNWRHFQQIKNEICGDFFEAVELYPSEARIADNANQYHLFVMPEGVDIPIGFAGGMVVIDDDEVAEYNANGDKGRQEPMQEGLTVGQGMNDHQRITGDTDNPARKAIIGGSLNRHPHGREA